MVGMTFHGERLRLARVALGLTLEQLGARVSATRQYLNQLEQGIKLPTNEMSDALADALGVARHFFSLSLDNGIQAEQCHFRKQRTTPVSIVSQVLARGTLLDRFVSKLDRELDLPPVSFPDIPVSSLHEAEDAAEAARQHWRLGTGPISNMMRVVENAGAVVSFFDGVSERVDALSIDTVRPLIIRSEAKPAACRLRFDLAHEAGHLIMHKGVQTGDKETEDQANRFASAFLLPRSAFVHEFPRGRFLDWTAIFDMKLRWKVAVSAILRRAYDLKMISADQYRTGYIHLSKTGQRKQERYDEIIASEVPELLPRAISTLESVFPGSIERLVGECGLEREMFGQVSGLELPSSDVDNSNVVPLRYER
ncbi:helix-turn-helix domain-containing protein [Oceanibaculum nanhaiense]|uniref:helix-turn-helix domain-containing protein n=1 Tax=Oceanibaculum nanhaiense TaxID=1909734 RepID=UPI00396E3513